VLTHSIQMPRTERELLSKLGTAIKKTNRVITHMMMMKMMAGSATHFLVVDSKAKMLGKEIKAQVQ